MTSLHQLLVTFILILTLTLTGCGGKEVSATSPDGFASQSRVSGKLTEVPPPVILQQLGKILDRYQPQVKIISPQANEILEDNRTTVRFFVQDFPIFKNEEFGLGPHLHLFLDDQPYQAIYDLSKPVILENLSPGTHTLRVFASRPWHESFKNESAYDQISFHVFTKTEDNLPKANLPLLTYSRPQGDYGAEPIMLDYYLTNTPLHLVAQETTNDEVNDWRIRVTINGESFLMDEWQPLYLKGWQKGKNWVKLELIDDSGKSVENVFNGQVRLINYQPNGQDTLSKIVRGQFSLEEIKGIVDANYQPEPEIETSPISESSPTVEASPVLTPSPELIVEPSPTVEASPILTPSPELIVEPSPTVEASPILTPSPELKEEEKESLTFQPSPELKGEEEESLTFQSSSEIEKNPVIESSVELKAEESFENNSSDEKITEESVIDTPETIISESENTVPSETLQPLNSPATPLEVTETSEIKPSFNEEETLAENPILQFWNNQVMSRVNSIFGQ